MKLLVTTVIKTEKNKGIIIHALKLFLGLSLALLPALSFAEHSAEELAKAAQNPIASMVSLPLQNNTNLNIGHNDSTQNIFNIQPVWPFEINDDWNFITRTIIPVLSNPSVLTGLDNDRVDGVGDTVFTGFFSPKDSGNITWGPLQYT